MTSTFVSRCGEDPAWPFNRLVAAYDERGWPLDVHRSDNGAAQSVKGQCPCGEHVTSGRDFWFSEYPNGRVRAGGFKGKGSDCDLVAVLGTIGMEPKDLHTSPRGEDLPDLSLISEEDLTAPHLPALPVYPVRALCGPLREQAEAAMKDGLPPALAAGAGLAALAAVSGLADLKVSPTRIVRPCLWVPLIGPPGAGKTPCIRFSFGRLRELNAETHALLRASMATWREEMKGKGEKPDRPVDETRLIGDGTLEAIIRWLDRGDGTGAIDEDELTSWLHRMSKYRKGGGSDVSEWLKMWSGEPHRYQRVEGDIDLLISRPVLSVCGGLQPKLLHLLGGEDSGLRPRFLPHISLDTGLAQHGVAPAPRWAQVIETLYLNRTRREWELTGKAREAWREASAGWRAEMQGAESASTSAALAKADEQCARIALPVAESLAPGCGGEVPIEAVQTAISITSYVMDCWRALPDNRTMATSRKDETLYGAVDELADWLSRRPGGKAPRRDIQRAHVAGIRDGVRLSEVLYLYERVYPGSVTDVAPPGAGRPGTYVAAPRRGIGNLSPGDKFLDTPAPEPPEEPAGQETGQDQQEFVASGDKFGGDKISGDKFPSPAPATDSDDALRVSAGWAPPEWSFIDTADGLSEVLPRILQARGVGLDTETTGLDVLRDKVRLVQLAAEGGGTYVIDAGKVDIKALQPVLDEAAALILHNAKFDLLMLLQAGLTMPADIGHRIRDTMLASMLLTAGGPDQNKNRLEHVAARHLGIELDKSLQESNWSGDLTQDQLRYAAADAAILLELRDKVAQELSGAGLRPVASLENRCLPAVVWMQRAGCPFDWDNHASAVTSLELATAAAEQAFHLEAAGRTGNGDINLNSPQQLKALFAAAGVDLPLDRAGKPSTAKDCLAKVDDDLARLLLAHRKVSKQLSTYGAPYPKWRGPDGRIHADWKQLGSDAGRMACGEPNLQQLPHAGGFRRLVKAGEGQTLIAADYSQVQLRIAAEFSQDPVMIAAYQEGLDLHRLTAQKVLGRENPQDVTDSERKRAKAPNFALLFGAGSERIRAQALSDYGVVMSAEEAGEWKAGLFRTYQGLRQWQQKQARGDGIRVDTRTLAGRRRLGISAYTEKLNTPIQGSEADGMKLALALLYERRDQIPGAQLILAVHDEVVLEVPEGLAQEAAKLLETTMEEGMKEFVKSVPVVAEAQVIPTYGDKK